MSMRFTNILDNMNLNRNVNSSAFRVLRSAYRRNGSSSAFCVLCSAFELEGK